MHPLRALENSYRYSVISVFYHLYLRSLIPFLILNAKHKVLTYYIQVGYQFELLFCIVSLILNIFIYLLLLRRSYMIII